MDETGTKVTGARWWLHVAATDTLTSYHSNTSRGRLAITALGVLDEFTETLVHDGWSAYNRYDVPNVLCGAHIARELLAACETHPDQHWPVQALDALFALNAAADQAHERGDPASPTTDRRSSAAVVAPGHRGGPVAAFARPGP